MTESFSYEIPEEEREYYEWRKNAQRHGLLHDATLAYYLSDSKHLYTIAVDGDLETAPIFTYRKWLEPHHPLDTPIGGVSSDPIVDDYDEDVMLEMAKSIAYTDGSYEGDADEYIWNDPVFAANNATTETLSFNLVESDYFTVKNAAVQLKDELYRSLYERGVEPDAPYLDVVDHINEINTPLRDEYYRNFEQVLKFHDGPRLAGCSVVSVFNTGDDYVIPIETRSSKVSESSGWKNPIPAGVLQPAEGEAERLAQMDTDDLTILQEHIFEEYKGSFLDEDNQEEGLEALQEALETDDGHLIYTSSGIDCKQTYLQFYGLLFIDDPEYYEEHIEGHDLGGWEAEKVELVSLSDGERLKELLDRHTMNPYNLLGFAEALFTLRDVYDIELPIDLSRT